MPQITYTGTFKVIRQIVDWINNFVPAPSEDPRFEVHQYTDINGNIVNALYQVLEDDT
jgi:hypothetical protein